MKKPKSPQIILGTPPVICSEKQKKQWNNNPMSLCLVFIHVVNPDGTSDGNTTPYGCFPDSKTAKAFCDYWNTQKQGVYSYRKVRRLNSLWETPPKKRKLT
jgi:hypothetical protein